MFQPQDIMQDAAMKYEGKVQNSKFLKLGIYQYQEIFSFLMPGKLL